MSAVRWRIALASAVAVVVLVTAGLLRQRIEPDRSLEKVQQAGVLVVGLDPSYPPFEVVNGQGELDGFDVDLVRAIAQQLGVKASLVSIDFGGIFDALEVGKFDAIIGGVSPSPDQSITFGFTKPYYDAGLVVLIGTTDRGQVLGYESGSDADLNLDTLRQSLSGFELRPFDDQDRMRAGLEQKTLRGVVIDAVTASAWAGDLPGLVIRPQRLTPDPFSVATRAGDQALLRAIDQALERLQAAGSLAALEQKWLPE